jgi:predicted nucleic acid-binding protein
MALLDTDIMVDVMRQYPPALVWLKSLGEEEVILPGFVVMELIQGCRNKAEQRRVEKALKGRAVVWPSPEICDEALGLIGRPEMIKPGYLRPDEIVSFHVKQLQRAFHGHPIGETSGICQGIGWRRDTFSAAD